MKNYSSWLLRMILMPFFEVFAFTLAFYLAYNLRSFTDGIPFVQLKIPHINGEQFVPFVLSWVALWVGVFIYAKLYSHIQRPLFAENYRVIRYSFFWFFIYIGFVYLTTGFLFFKEIPRLIIFYTLIFGTIFSLIIRTGIYFFWRFLSEKNFIEKQKILILKKEIDDDTIFTPQPNGEYFYHTLAEKNTIENMIRNNKIDAILFASNMGNNADFITIFWLARIYGISCSYPQIDPSIRHFSREESFISGIPVITMKAVAITPWGHILKRIFDIVGSIFFLILASPILLIAYIGIKIEDPTGPVIYKNRRIGQNGKIFTLYKFRYMYWKYCTKENYLKEWEKDEWLEFEENLKKTHDSRNGPLYKIQNDPRKMKFWWFLEKFSIDELPQLFNVLLGNMSIVGPRPHQPREVTLYDESDKQVLTIKPGITGMAQVYGRDKNTFKEEVALDTYYIENYTFFLDILIIFRTIFVILKRPFEKK